MDRKEGQKPGPRESSSEILGPYVLLAELARGELTTVHLGKKQGPLGFQRLVAVKRLRSVYARQPDAAQLLLDEARLTSRLHHANVAGVHDVGSESGCYVVMDYIEGANLEQLLARAGRERHPRYILPIIVDLLNGLHAVHTAMGEDGEPLRMVHQAPCARHVMVGADGTARLVDFSQATARVVQPSRARSDRLRISVMAPEQALEPEHVDARSDLFIVGLTLWEALTGEPLFAAETEAVGFQNLLHRRIQKPSEVGLKPPRFLDSVVMRALDRDPKHRYHNALEMARDLRDAALNHALYATPGELGQWVQALAGREIAEHRKRAGADGAEEGSGASGLYFSRQNAEGDPYHDGVIHGGSYSHVDPSGIDPDKTPTFGVRTSLAPGEMERLRESTASRPPDLLSRPARIVEVQAPPRQSRGPAAPQAPSSVTPSGARLSEGLEYSGRSPNSVAQRLSGPGPLGAAEVSDSSTARGSLPNAQTQVSEPVPAHSSGQKRGSEETEYTSPGGFVPARPGARRDPSLPSPGAYSEVKNSKRRSNAPELFDEVDTSRIDSPLRGSSASPLPQSHSSRLPSGRTSSPGEHYSAGARDEYARPSPYGTRPRSDPPPDFQSGVPDRLRGHPPAARPASDPPLLLSRPRQGREELVTDTSRTRVREARDEMVSDTARTRVADMSRLRAATEGPGLTGGRHDSAPGRMNLPDGPVGTPLWGAANRGDYENPRPPTLEQMSQRRTSYDDMLTMPDSSVLQQDSLSPPTGPARTAPPIDPNQDLRAKGLLFWIGTGLLTGIIAVAGFVGVRNWAERHAAGPGVDAPVVSLDVGPVTPSAPVALPSEAPEAPPAEAPAPVAAQAAPAPVEKRAAAPAAQVAPAAAVNTLTTAPIAPGHPVVPVPTALAAKKKLSKRSGASADGAAAPVAAAPAAAESADAPAVSSDLQERKPPSRHAAIPENPY